MDIKSESLLPFQRVIAVRVQALRSQAYELNQDASLIEKAWDRLDLNDLVSLKVLDPAQAAELRVLLETSDDL